MGANADSAQIPSKAVSDDADVRQPVRALLEDLKLLGSPAEEDRATGVISAFVGPPQSVALIEAGATAAAKWWAAGLGATVLPIWGSVAAWLPKQDVPVRVVVLGGALLVTAALILAIGYLIASDVRGRAAASVSMIEARAELAKEMLCAVQNVYKPTPADPPAAIVALPSRVPVKNLGRPANDEEGWFAIAMQPHADGNKYIVVKGSNEEALPASKLDFDAVGQLG